MLPLTAALLFSPSCAPPSSFDEPTHISPGPHARTYVSFYDVEGSTADELAASLRERAPRRDAGQAYGEHVWEVHWSFRYVRDRGECRLRDVLVELISTTTLPRWEAGPDASEELLGQWNAFTAALFEHERVHHANGAAAAREVQSALGSLRRLRCETITREADQAARRIVDRYREADLRYDRRTEHGRTQGAIWPLP